MDDDLPVDLAKFGRRVRKTREAQGLSLRNLAVRVGMSNPALSQAERGIKLSREDYDSLRRWLGDEGAAGVPARR